MKNNDKLIIAILLSQILVESLLSLFEGTKYYAGSYFVPSYLLHCGVLPAIFLLSNSVSRIAKILSLTLIIFELFRTFLEFLAGVIGEDRLVSEINRFDFYGFTFILSSFFLSLLLNGLLNSNSKLTIYILLLLQKIKCFKTANFRTKKRD